jgi:cytoskeletal protein CcmA (bactofilin family)
MFKKNKENTEQSTPGLLNIIGSGTSVTGDLISEGDIRIDGNIKGNIQAKSRLVIGEACSVEGNIQARHATIAGRLKGNIIVAETLLLKASARIDGDITTEKIIIESGAQFNGLCSMSVAKSDHVKQATHVKSAQPSAAEA